MKTIKQTLATLLCLLLLVGCVSMTVQAEEPTGTITIQNPSDSDATVVGKTFNVYKIFNATTNGTNIAYSWYQPDEDKLPPFYDFFYGATGKLGEQDNGSAQAAIDYVAGYESNSLAMSQFAEELHLYIENANKAAADSVPLYTSVKCEDANADSLEIPGLTYGYYLVYDATDLTSSESSVRSAVMVDTVNKDIVITLKAIRPQITKQVLDNNGSFGEGTSSTIGDEITFKLSTTIPNHTLYTAYTYTIEDVMPDGLELVADSFTVKSGGETVPAADYEITAPGTGDKDFVIALKDVEDHEAGDVFAPGQNIEITYKAKLTTAAEKVNVNTATLVYSNDPMKEDLTGKVSDTATVYSYQFVFSKFAKNSNTRLAGATFQLYRVNADNSETLIKFKKVDAQDDHNGTTVTYTKYVVDPAATADVLETHNTGDAHITLDHLNYGGHLGDVSVFGLAEGTYKLVETQAPSGYITPEHPFMVEITDEIGTDGVVTSLSAKGSHEGTVGNIINVDGRGEAILTVWADIENQSGEELPETGGVGTTLFTVLGVVLMAGAIAFFGSRKRNSAA